MKLFILKMLGKTEYRKKGFPSVFVVTRTPYSLASASFYQLKASTIDESDPQHASNITSTENSPASASSELPLENSSKQPLRRIAASNEHRQSIDSTLGSEGIKQFEFPAGFDKPLCKLDAASPEVPISPEASQIVTQLQQIQTRLSAGGGSATGVRDAHNVWIQSSLGALLTQQLKPQNPSCKVNSVRNFLYDLGYVNDKSFGTTLQPLDSGNSEEFYRDLHQIVDRTHTRIAQTVGIFFVKEGQKNVIDILENSLFLDETSPEFCHFLSELGECVDVSCHPYWSGHFATAFSSERKPIESQPEPQYAFDGISHCLWWSDSLLEIAYVLYSERSYRMNNLLPGGEAKEPKFSVCTKAKESVVDSAFEDDTSISTGGFNTPPTRHPSSHHFHRQIKPILPVPEMNNNNNTSCGKVGCLSENNILSSHSPHVRRCLSVSTAASLHSPVAALAAAATSISSSIVDSTDSQKLSPNPRLYTRHHTSRQTSLSPRVYNFLDDISSTESVGGFLRSENNLNGFENHDFDALAKSPSATYTYLKSFFRRVKTPEPFFDEKQHPTTPTTPVTVPTFDALACDRLITDAVSMPSTPHSTFNTNPLHRQHSRPFRPNSPTSTDPQNSRRSDVSHSSLHSNSTSSNYTTSKTAQSNRTKSSSTINSDQGSAATHKISSIQGSTEKTPKRCLDQRVFVVWLERLEDMYHFPYEQLFEITEDGSRYTSPKPDHVTIFLYMAEPGLVRIHIEGIWTKYGQPGPLADGSVVSLGSLPQLLRETICSIARRKCLEVDTFQASSTRRQKAIQEFSKKYLTNQNYEEFLDSFITLS
uniref:Rap-GAP domain-containing protein n=1 Tax=Panagrolaimus superbus TaxID=310955 RepID=A0A914YH21_9BILA